jgi:hypothetical protein
MRVERTFAWEDKFKRLLLRFERIQQRHYGMKLMAYKQNLENLRRNHYAPNGMCETNVLRSQGAKPCAPSQATFPSMRCRPERPS